MVNKFPLVLSIYTSSKLFHSSLKLRSINHFDASDNTWYSTSLNLLMDPMISNFNDIALRTKPCRAFNYMTSISLDLGINMQDNMFISSNKWRFENRCMNLSYIVWIQKQAWLIRTRWHWIRTMTKLELQPWPTFPTCFFSLNHHVPLSIASFISNFLNIKSQ